MTAVHHLIVTARLSGADTCDEFCAVSAICGALPPGQLELECVGRCREIVETRDRERLPKFGGV